ncbi:MAG: flavodoxin family protein [Planctomycetota bacterium]|nr:flavodoxin family protein [Planctomycetota bacterium]
MKNVAIVYFSAAGHTQQLAHAIAEGVRSVPQTTAVLWRIEGSDLREGRWKNQEVTDGLQRADTIVFGSPTYMGGMAAQYKSFIDACGGIWYEQAWRNKLAAGFTHSQGLSGDKLNTLEGLMIQAMQHGMLWVSLGMLPEGSSPEQINRIGSYIGLMAQSQADQTNLFEGDRQTARLFGQRIADATHRWQRT